MRASSALAAFLLVAGINAPRLASQHRRAIHPAVGLGRLVADDVHGALGHAGFAAYGRLTWWAASGVSLLVDGWFHSVSVNHDIVTAPCPPATPCGSPSFSGGTTALVLAPALQAREGYERVALLYRLGPSVAWFAHHAPSTDAAAVGVRGGFSVLTSRGASGVLLSVDYLRVFRNHAGPRWFLPITIGWQF